MSEFSNVSDFDALIDDVVVAVESGDFEVPTR